MFFGENRAISKRLGLCLSFLMLSHLSEAADRGLGLGAVPLSVRSVHSPAAARPSFFAKGLEAQGTKDYAEALVQFEKAAATTDIRRHSLAWLSAQFQACQTLNLLGKKTAAVAKAHEIVNACESQLGMEDTLTSEALSHLAFLLRQNGRLKEAEPVYTKNLTHLEDKHGDDSFFAAYARARLANLLMSLGRLEEAEKLHRASLLAVQTNLEHEAQADHCYFITHLGYCLHIRGKETEAAALMGRAHAMVRAPDVLSFAHAGSTLRRQAEYFRDVRQLDKARATGRLCLEWISRKGDADRIRFFYHEPIQQLYRSILDADGLKSQEIDTHLAEVEEQARGGN